ncbi:hypothetical protein DLH72_04870 [Candidatus Gracilibacteria bacterium]|nr:MAG: hypothetical protein DLH72_04870 [Candidatus Gracilibacteria bacterium]
MGDGLIMVTDIRILTYIAVIVGMILFSIVLQLFNILRADRRNNVKKQFEGEEFDFKKFINVGIDSHEENKRIRKNKNKFNFVELHDRAMFKIEEVASISRTKDGEGEYDAIQIVFKNKSTLKMDNTDIPHTHRIDNTVNYYGCKKVSINDIYKALRIILINYNEPSYKDENKFNEYVAINQGIVNVYGLGFIYQMKFHQLKLGLPKKNTLNY